MGTQKMAANLRHLAARRHAPLGFVAIPRHMHVNATVLAWNAATEQRRSRIVVNAATIVIRTPMQAISTSCNGTVSSRNAPPRSATRPDGAYAVYATLHAPIPAPTFAIVGIAIGYAAWATTLSPPPKRMCWSGGVRRGNVSRVNASRVGRIAIMPPFPDVKRMERAAVRRIHRGHPARLRDFTSLHLQ